MQMKKYLILILALLIMGTSIDDAIAKEVKFEASLDRNQIGLGDAAQLGLTFYGTQSIPAPDIGNIAGLEIRYLGPSTMMTVINGKISSSITHMYSVLPLKTGKFQLGPFSFNYKSDSYTSSIVFLDVLEERPVKEEKKEAEEPLTGKFNLEDRLFLTLSADKTHAYVNELIPVTVKMYVNRLNLSDIQLPTFGQEGFSKIEFKEPKQYKEEVGGILYDVLEFKTNIFGTRPGDYHLGPAQIKCNLVLRKRMRRPVSAADDLFDDDYRRDSFFDDFFTRYERHPMELKSQDIPLTISPLPAEGRPQDFSGAVGDYQFIFNASPTKVKVGDPITLKMDINGTGNFNTVLIPKLENIDGFKVYEPQVKTGDNYKTFTQVLIPETDQIIQTPKAVFSYFDTDRKTYRTIAQGPIQIQVEKGKEEAPAQVIGPVYVSPVQAPEEMRRDIIYIKESPGALVKKDYRIYRNKIFLGLIILPLVFLISVYIVYKKSERLRRDTRYARHLRAYKVARKSFKALNQQLKSNNAPLFYETAFKTLQGYLGDKLHLPSEGITADVVDQILRPKEIDLEIMRKIKSLFETCDQVRFALLKVDDFRMKDDLKELEEVIRYFERLKL